MRRRKPTGVLIAIALLTAAPATGAAAAGQAYSGQTSQKGGSVKLRIVNGAVHNFKIVVFDKCPDGHKLKVTSNYPPMSINNGKFGGRFVPIKKHRGETATLKGTVAGSHVSGTISDTSFSSQERRLCHGSAQFTAHRH